MNLVGMIFNLYFPASFVALEKIYVLGTLSVKQTLVNTG